MMYLQTFSHVFCLFFLIEKNEDLRTSKCVYTLLTNMKTVVLVLVHLHTFLLDFF